MKKHPAVSFVPMVLVFALVGLYYAMHNKPRAESYTGYTNNQNSISPNTQADMSKRAYRNKAPAVKTFDLVTTNNTLAEPSTIETDKNVPLRISITSHDQSEGELHIPEFNQGTTIESGLQKSLNFTPDHSGTFEIRIVNNEPGEGPVISNVVGTFVVH